MKTIIHDLPEQKASLLSGIQAHLISADGKYAPCQGCFGCWTKTPAECYMKDALHTVCRTIGHADELVIITENCYGAYSPAVKNVLDRSIGLSTPFSTYRGKQMHHTLGYGKKDRLTVYAYGDMTEAEKATFQYMAERNAINFGFRSFSFTHLKSLEEMEGMKL